MHKEIKKLLLPFQFKWIIQKKFEIWIERTNLSKIQNKLTSWLMPKLTIRNLRNHNLMTKIIEWNAQDEKRGHKSGRQKAFGKTWNRQERDHQQETAQSCENSRTNGQSKHLQWHRTRSATFIKDLLILNWLQQVSKNDALWPFINALQVSLFRIVLESQDSNWC